MTLGGVCGSGLTCGGNSICPVWVPPGCVAPPHVTWAWEAPLSYPGFASLACRSGRLAGMAGEHA